jgi:hypothetical protein
VRALRIGAFLAFALVVLVALWQVSTARKDEPAAEMDLANATTFSKILAAESFTLANGLQVAVIPDPKSAEIFHMVWYKVGAADDPPGKSGLAHFVEHLTFGGTQTFTEREFTRTLKHVGDKQDAFTTRDQTVYYQMVPPKHLATVMQLEADRMSNVVVTEESMASEREEVLEERQEMDHDPRALLDYRMHTVLYRDHPYGIPGLGWPQEMDSITPEEAIAFYRLWYAPNNAIVLVYGDITVEEVKPLIEKYYGGIPARAIPARRMPNEVMPKEAQSVVINDNRASESIWRRSYLAPSYTAGATEHTDEIDKRLVLVTITPARVTAGQRAVCRLRAPSRGQFKEFASGLRRPCSWAALASGQQILRRRARLARRGPVPDRAPASGCRRPPRPSARVLQASPPAVLVPGALQPLTQAGSRRNLRCRQAHAR